MLLLGLPTNAESAIEQHLCYSATYGVSDKHYIISKLYKTK